LEASVVRPTHTSHGSQVLRHDGVGVHGRQAEGSVTWAASQVPTFCAEEPIHTNLPLAAGSSQQPKQSQPLGVMGKQVSRQALACVVLKPSQVELLPGTLAFGSYAQRESPLGGNSGATESGSHSWLQWHWSLPEPVSWSK
jgi:hypothetical protein